MMGGDFLRKRIVKVKISQEQMTLLRLKSAITDLSDELGDSTKKPYKVTVRKIPPVETDLVTVGKINNTIKFEVREKSHITTRLIFISRSEDKAAGAIELAISLQ